MPSSKSNGSPDRKGLLKFMLEPGEDGTYEVTVPTDEQLAAVLPWLIDQAIMVSRNGYYCGYINEALPGILGKLNGRTNVDKFYAADGYDASGLNRKGFNTKGYDHRGYDKEGFNKYGYNQDGYSRDGFDGDGYDKEGYNRNGKDYRGRTREEVIGDLVKQWSPQYAAAIALKLAEQETTHA